MAADANSANPVAAPAGPSTTMNPNTPAVSGGAGPSHLSAASEAAPPLAKRQRASALAAKAFIARIANDDAHGVDTPEPLPRQNEAAAEMELEVIDEAQELEQLAAQVLLSMAGWRPSEG
jgi:hypothetical protein